MVEKTAEEPKAAKILVSVLSVSDLQETAENTKHHQVASEAIANLEDRVNELAQECERLAFSIVSTARHAEESDTTIAVLRGERENFYHHYRRHFQEFSKISEWCRSIFPTSF